MLPPDVEAVVDVFAALQSKWTYRAMPLGFGSISLRAGIPGDEVEREARLRGLWPFSELEIDLFRSCEAVIREQDADNYQSQAEKLASEK